jgi:tetrapyrrole methylase family protein/MazG family protein
VQDKARRAGFDWQQIDGPLDKVAEEFGELREQWQQENPNADRVAEEFGDLLFALVNVGRFLPVVPEDALRLAVDKFDTRFRAMEKIVEERGEQLRELDLQAMDAVWDEVKNSSEP